MTDERDELLARIRAALRELPVVDPSARARLLVAVAAERERDMTTRERHRSAGWVAAAAGLVAAVLVVGWLAWPTSSVDRAGAHPIAVTPAALDAPTTHATLAGEGTDAATLRRVQLVFRAPVARSVSVVGDFTEWDAHRAPMTRDSASGLWSVTIALRPGRHVYAFLVDDTMWVQDPRALEAPDADFGRPGSVLLVGQP